jgi:hypothetical protein
MKLFVCRNGSLNIDEIVCIRINCDYDPNEDGDYATVTLKSPCVGGLEARRTMFALSKRDYEELVSLLTTNGYVI